MAVCFAASTKEFTSSRGDDFGLNDDEDDDVDDDGIDLIRTFRDGRAITARRAVIKRTNIANTTRGERRQQKSRSDCFGR